MAVAEDLGGLLERGVPYLPDLRQTLSDALLRCPGDHCPAGLHDLYPFGPVAEYQSGSAEPERLLLQPPRVRGDELRPLGEGEGVDVGEWADHGDVLRGEDAELSHPRLRPGVDAEDDPGPQARNSLEDAVQGLR